ncbi:MAG: ABC transporter ATP-binding protein [Candidatus Thorarchaeota archaeon]
MIDCHDVIKIYSDEETKNRIAALRGIDLQVNRGEVVSIIGPSGSGKSTLIKILAGMESISSGTVRVGIDELQKMTSKELLDYRLKTVGIVHQFPERTLFLTGTVFDNLSFAASLNSKNKKENRLRNITIMKELAIDHLANRRVQVLSGGEMIRTAIACVLAKNSPLLLCDEPTGQLDSENTEKVKQLLRQVAKEYNTTILVVTHDLRFLNGVDRTCEIHSGRVSSLINVEGRIDQKEKTFPMNFDSYIDSSQSVRIPNTIYNLLQLKKSMRFILNEDSTVKIVHPEGFPPRKLELEEKIKRKKLHINKLPEDYSEGKIIDIKLFDVSKVYGNKSNQVKALANIDFEIYRGELIFIIGPSGSGKTTLMKLMTGIEPCSSGEISVLKEKINLFTDLERSRFRRKNIGIVSQQGDLHPYLTILENMFLKDILSYKDINTSKLPNEKVDDIFNTFQIDYRRNAFPMEISGGELQRASLVCAQFNSPPILVLDEPTANMDSELALDIMNQLISIHQKLNVTTIITTHDINLVNDGNRVIELMDGRIKVDGLAHPLEE